MRIINKRRNRDEIKSKNRVVTVSVGWTSALSVQERGSGSSGHAPVKVQLQQNKPPG